ncbi:MAG: methyltransferase domain-containing protein [Polyangiales bacterium]
MSHHPRPQSCLVTHTPHGARQRQSALARVSFVLALAGVGQLALGCASSSKPPAAESPTPARTVHKREPLPPPPEPDPGPKYEAVDPETAPKQEPVKVSKANQTIIDAKDRNEADRALDAGRHPGELLTFFDVKPGQKVAEIGAGEGYTSELLARAVGKKGKVYAQNSQRVLDRVGDAWKERLARPANKQIVRADRELDDPLPADAKNLDAVFSVLVYHDLVGANVDREKLNAAVFKALKPGGVYAVVDHSGRTRSGTDEVSSLHRIEESVVREEIEKAGFKLAGEGHFLRNPADARDWNDAPSAAADRRGTSDRFVLKFEKPK